MLLLITHCKIVKSCSQLSHRNFWEESSKCNNFHMFLRRPWQGLTAHQGAAVPSFGIAAIDHKLIFKSQKPQSVMVFAAVTTDGHKSLIIFVEANTKINSDIYIEILMDKIYPWVLFIYGKGPFVFQQDGAPSHTARKTQEWFTVNFPGFWHKYIWPPYSPDLNVTHYSIWSVLESKASAKPHWNVVHPKQSLKKGWASIPRQTIVSACSYF